MLRWATIHKKLVARLCATLVASGSLVMAGEIKKNRHPIRRVSAEETAVEVAEATEAAEPVDFAETDADAVPAELAQAERAAEREQTAGDAEAADDGADVFDAALHPDPWCAPGAFTGPRQPSQYDSQMQNAIQNPQAAMNQPRNNFDFSGGQNYVSAGSSRNVPAFMGDAFGGGGAQTVVLPGLATDIPNGLKTVGAIPISSIDTTGHAKFSGIGYYGPGPAFNPIAVGSVSSANQIFNPPGGTASIIPWKDQAGFDFFTLGPMTDPAVLAQVLIQNGIDPTKFFVAIPSGTAALVVAGTDANGITDKQVTPQSDTTPLVTGADTFRIILNEKQVPLVEAKVPVSTTAGRVKLSENSSPIPRDRILINYSYFSNVGIADGGVNVNRITPGFEKTLFSKNLSLEVRTPMAVTLDQDLALDSNNVMGRQGFNQVEMGDVTATLKALFYESGSTALSTGMGMSFPTSDDISLRLSNGLESLRIDHRSVHLMPFVGGVYAPNDQFFGQWIAQVDVAANGDPVLMNTDPNALFAKAPYSDPQGLHRTGKLSDPAFLYLDANAGYWMYRSDDPNESGLSGFALVSELHYNRSLHNFGQVSSSISGVDPKVRQFTVGDNRAYLEQLNFMIGCVTEIGGNSVISTGYAVPLTGSPIFSGEFRMTYNYYFGRSSRRVNQFGNRPPGLL